MKAAGIREVRQNLSALIDQVKKGREIVITEHGKPVARLVGPPRDLNKPFPDLSKFRRSLKVPPGTAERLIEIIEEDRNDRI